MIPLFCILAVVENSELRELFPREPGKYFLPGRE